MSKTTSTAALAAATLALGGLVAGGAHAQGFDRFQDRGFGGPSFGQQERFGDAERSWREQYERGYQMGRQDERRRMMDGQQSGSGPMGSIMTTVKVD